jgi:hypothetical protein
MKHTLKTLSLAILLMAFCSVGLFAQASLTQTTLAAAVTASNTQYIVVTSATGITAPSLSAGTSTQIYIDTELMDVEAVNGTTLTVRRGAGGTRATTHNSAQVVYAGPPNYFSVYPRWGSCTAAKEIVLPVIDVLDQYIFNCVTGTNGVGTWVVVISGTTNYPVVQTLSTAYTNATTTFSSVPGMLFPVHAGVSYTLRCDLIWQGSATTTGPKYQFTGPGSPTAVASNAISAITASTYAQVSATAFSTSMPNTGTITATTNFHDIVTLGLVNGANTGTVQLQAAANGSGTLTIQPGSFCVQQ